MALSLRTLLVIFPLMVTSSLQYPLPSTSNFDEEDWEETSEEEEPFVEGDIVIGSESIPVIDFRSHVQCNLLAEPRLLWPDRRVFYDYSGHFPSNLKVYVHDALDDVMAQSCVQFVQRSCQKTYLKLRATGKGCATKVGFQHDVRGPLDLHVGGRKCHTRGTIQHEFLHALGFWHEHTRPDRNKYVKVHWDSVRSGRESNFVIRPSNDSASLGLPYDFASVMHYKPTAFGRKKGEVTLEPRVKIKEAWKVMGQRRGVTKLDIAKLNRLYNCTEGPKGSYYRGDELEGMDVVIGEVEELEPKKILKGEEENSKEIIGEMKEKGENMVVKVKEKILIEEIMVEESLEKFVDVEEVPGSSEIDCTEKPGSAHINGEGAVGHSKFKRQVSNSKHPMDEKGGVAPPNAHSESFAPQKILPELLKGVLDKDGDRPIVIQFAIYQPIVYKTANESEGDKITESKTGAKTDKEQAAVDSVGSNRKSDAFVSENGHEDRSGFNHDDIDLRSFVGREDYHDRRNDKSGDNVPVVLETRPDPSRDYIRQQLPEIHSAKVPFIRTESSSTQTDDFDHQEEPRQFKITKEEYSRSPSRSDEKYSSDHVGEYSPSSARREFEDDHFTFPSKEYIQPLQASKKNVYLPSDRVKADNFHDPIKRDEYYSNPRGNSRTEPQEPIITKQVPFRESNSGYSEIPTNPEEAPICTTSYDTNRKDEFVSHPDTACVPTIEDHFESSHGDNLGSHNTPSASEEHFSSNQDERNFGFSQDSQPKEHLEEVTMQYADNQEFHETKNDNRRYLVIDQKTNREGGSIKLGKNGPFPQENVDNNQQHKEKQDKYGSSSRDVRVKIENVAPDWKGDDERVGSRQAPNQNNFRNDVGNQHEYGPSEGSAKFDEKTSERGRVKARPDLSLEDDFNFKPDQERRQKSFEKMPEDTNARMSLPTTNLQKQSAEKPRVARVNIARTLLSSKAVPIRRTANRNPKRDIQDEIPPDPEELVEDDILITKPMVNLYPRQALPLRSCVDVDALKAKITSR